MVLCEHFIYTSAKTEEKSGYQIIAKSTGITEKIINELDNYLYPIGTESGEFKSSISLKILTDHVAFTRVRNIGISYDGRPDTIYNHTIVMEKNDFKKFDNDSRIFNDKYIEEIKLGHLSPIIIKKKKIQPDFTIISELGIELIECVLHYLFLGKKIAFVDFNHEKLIQNILSITPPSLRLISFSSLVANQIRQPDYDVIQIRKQNLTKSKTMELYFNSIPKFKRSENELYENCFRYIINILKTRSREKLEILFEEFEEINGTLNEKIIFAVMPLKIKDESYLTEPDQIIKFEEFLDKTTSKFADIVKNEFKPHLGEDHFSKYKIKNVILKHAKDELNVKTLEKMLSQSDGTSLSRNKLFHELVKKRLKDFQDNGIQILIDIMHRYYNNDVIQGFIEESRLHSAFDGIFKNSTDIKIEDKKNLFSLTIKNSLCSNPKLLDKLFNYDVFNLEKDEDVKKFKDNIEWIYSAKEFHQELEPEKIYSISNNIILKIFPIFPKNKKSGTIENRWYDLEKIFNMILNTLRYLLTMRKFELTNNLERIKKMEIELTEFLNENSLLDSKFNWNVIPKIDKKYFSIMSWWIFSNCSYRCK